MSPVDAFTWRPDLDSGKGLWVHPSKLALPPSTGPIVVPGPGGLPPIINGIPFYERTPENGYELGWENYEWVWWVPAGSTFASPNGWRVIRSNSWSVGDLTDLNVVCPETWNTELQIRSGRNVHVFGGAIERLSSTVSNGHVPGYTSNYSGPGGAGQTALRINGRYTANLGPASRTWEGLHIKGEWTWEGINIYSQQDRQANQSWTLINQKTDQINVVRPTSGGHLGGDFNQIGNGFSINRMIGVDWRVAYYQGMFFQPLGDGSYSTIAADMLKEWTFKHVAIQGGSNHAQLIWDTTRNNATVNAGMTRVFEDIWITTAPSQVSAQSAGLNASQLAAIHMNEGIPPRLLLDSDKMGTNYVHIPTLAA